MKHEKINLIIPPLGDSVAERTADLMQHMLKFRLDIEASMRYGENTYSFDDICVGALQGRFHFYPAQDAFMIMELQKFPKYSIYHAFLAGGNLSTLLAMNDEIKVHAKTLGAKYATINGRHGWTKILKSEGWEHRYSILYKEVN